VFAKKERGEKRDIGAESRGGVPIPENTATVSREKKRRLKKNRMEDFATKERGPEGNHEGLFQIKEFGSKG